MTGPRPSVQPQPLLGVEGGWRAVFGRGGGISGFISAIIRVNAHNLPQRHIQSKQTLGLWCKQLPRSRFCSELPPFGLSSAIGVLSPLPTPTKHTPHTAAQGRGYYVSSPCKVRLCQKPSVKALSARCHACCHSSPPPPTTLPQDRVTDISSSVVPKMSCCSNINRLIFRLQALLLGLCKCHRPFPNALGPPSPAFCVRGCSGAFLGGGEPFLRSLIQL